MQVEFKGCEHLDYEPNYGNCKRQLISCNGTKLCWKRPAYASMNDLVQFCKRRGRINSPVGCLTEDNAVCSDFNEIDHVVDVPDKELES